MSGAMTRLRHLWSHHRAALVVFVLALIVTLLLAVRTTVFTVYWLDPAHRDQPLAGWMTPRYVAHSYAVPPKALGLPPPGPGDPWHITLDQIAARNGETLKALNARISAAVAAWRVAHP